MDKETSNLETLEELIKKADDIKNSYSAIVEKLALFSLFLEEAGMNSVADKLDGPISDSSRNAEFFEQLYKDVEMESNRLRMERH